MKKLFTFLIIGIFLIGLVSAAEWDNKKNYNPDTKEVKIVNALGLGENVAIIKLTSPLNFQVARGYQQVAEFDLIYYMDNNGGLDKIDFFDIKNSMNKIDRQFDYKIKTIEVVSVNDYEIICNEKLSENGTITNDCIQNIISTHLEERIVWNDFNEKDLKKSEQVTIGIFTDVQKGDSVEWIPTFYGVEIGEWAAWTQNLNVGLEAYYKLDEGVGASGIIIDATNRYNGTNIGGVNSTGKINSAYNTTIDPINISGLATVIDNQTTGTISLWFKGKIGNDGSSIFSAGNKTAGSDSIFGIYQRQNGTIQFYVGLTGLYAITINSTYNDSNWHHVVWEVNSSGNWFYIDGIQSSVSYIIGNATTSKWFNHITMNKVTIGNSSQIGGISSHYNGIIDEVGIWNRSLTPSEISDLYNSGSGISYGYVDKYPTVTLNSPIDNYNSSSANIIFNCTVSDEVNLINVSLYINGIINETNSSGVNANYTFSRTLTDNNYNWTCEATDNESQVTTASYRNLLIDTIYPTINITYPITYLNYGTLGSNETLNWTVNDTNLQSCWYNYNGTNTTVTCGVNTTTFKIEALKTNLTFYANDSVGNLNSTFVDWDYKVLENNRTHNSSTYDTARESYSINLTANASLTAVSLFYNGTYYSTTKYGDIWTYTRDVPSSVIGSQNFSYRFTYGGDYINSTQSNQVVNTTIFGLCNATITNDFLNISFKDESNASAISAAISTSSFVYYLGSGTVNKTYTLINNSGSTNYTFCAIPTNRILHVDPYVQYVSTNYPQRIWNPDVTNYNSTVTNQVLYLLESTDGLYVTFQIVNSADQILTGALIIATREIAGIETEVGRGTTGGDGSVTLWLNPDFTHTFTFSKDGFETYETSFAPTQSGYTITLGGGAVAESSYFKGINFFILPTNISLTNDTTYSFGFRLTSSFWDLDEYGFNLRLINGTIITGDTTTTSGTQLTLDYDTNNQTKIFMDYWWVINSTYTNGTRQWVVYNTDQTQWSIKNFFTDLNAYMDSGLFGIDEFGRYLLAFIIVFLSIGIMSYKFGLTSPIVVTTSIFLIIFFLDVVVGLIPPLLTIGGGRQIEHILTFASGIILAIFIFREASL